MKAPATRIMPCGHKFQCVISGHDDCQHMCAYHARKAEVQVAFKLPDCKCEQCGRPCHGISYCGCKGWD